MPTQIQLYVLFGLAGLIAASLSFVRGEPLGLALLVHLPGIVVGMTVALFIFDRWLWHWNRLYPWFVQVPNLRGTWCGTATSKESTKLPEENKASVDSEEVTVTIHQRYWSFTIAIDWPNNGRRTRFHEKGRLSVTAGVCAWASRYHFIDAQGSIIASRLAGLVFYVPPETFRNEPETVTIYYRTHDGLFGELNLRQQLSRNLAKSHS